MWISYEKLAAYNMTLYCIYYFNNPNKLVYKQRYWQTVKHTINHRSYNLPAIIAYSPPGRKHYIIDNQYIKQQ